MAGASTNRWAEVPRFRGLPPGTLYRFASAAETDSCGTCGRIARRFFGEETADGFTGSRGPFCGPDCYRAWLEEVNR